MADADFHEIVFPIAIGFGATGGPERRTEIVRLASGHEQRNARWADSRRRYNAGTGLHSTADLAVLLAFFEERRGRFHGFRWRDRLDRQSAPPGKAPGPLDQTIGTGDGATAAFQLAKSYGSGFAPYSRAIRKPVAGTVRVAVAGVEQSEGTAFTADPTSGVLTFLPGAIPPVGAAVTAGFAFDVPVRFDTDRLDINLAAFEAGEAPNIPIVEIRT
ncbi:DUF2460 domain-containing protein [Propylenella binzhouense]|uniref:TIGR02217 family protein n=1 Tax=Propylenella binzhouense TaxID=2555902 RepID=A0A964T8C3_9HYPH|nr:DUF2460 domain-containing protein [Propylenella binzhouense]MYZ50340.1 TIGR02217 family protein [Propylenella binzhouense]